MVSPTGRVLKAAKDGEGEDRESSSPTARGGWRDGANIVQRRRSSRALASTSSTLYSTLYSTHSLDASLDSSTLASAPPPRLYAPLASRMLDATGPRRYRTSTLQKTSTLVNLDTASTLQNLV